MGGNVCIFILLSVCCKVVLHNTDTTKKLCNGIKL